MNDHAGAQKSIEMPAFLRRHDQYVGPQSQRKALNVAYHHEALEWFVTFSVTNDGQTGRSESQPQNGQQTVDYDTGDVALYDRREDAQSRHPSSE
jgi:hypothetical protein